MKSQAREFFYVAEMRFHSLIILIKVIIQAADQNIKVMS